MSDTPLAAVVMAGGLGTRMRSAVPKHFHEILGRRMVDWVIATGRETGAAADRRRRLARRRATSSTERRHRRRAGDAARHGRRGALGARRARRPHGDILVLSGDTPLLTAEAARRARRDTPPRGRRRDDPHRRAARPPRLRSHRPRRRSGNVVRIVEGTDANEAEQQLREINSSIYVFRAEALWPALERLQPKNVQGELYLTDAIEILVADGAKVAAHIAADHRETDGVNTRVELASRRGRPARPDQRAAHARGRLDPRSADDVDRADRRARDRT